MVFKFPLNLNLTLMWGNTLFGGNDVKIGFSVNRRFSENIEVSIFDRPLEFLTEIWIFDRNLDFSTKFIFFDRILVFWPKFKLLTKF